MRTTELVCPIQVVPVDGPDGTVKQLVFPDMDHGEILTYKMEKDLVDLIVRQLKKSNKVLHLEIVEAQERAKAAALLAPNGGAGGMPGGDEAVREILQRDLRRDPK